MLDEVREQQGDDVLPWVKIVVTHPFHVGVVGGVVAPVGAVADYRVFVGVQGAQVGGNPFGQGDAVGVGGGGQRHYRQVRPVVLEQLRCHQAAEGYADEHGARGELGGENGGVVFLSRGGWEVEERDFRRRGQAGQQGVLEQPDGAVGTAAFAVEEENVLYHRVLSVILGNRKPHRVHVIAVYTLSPRKPSLSRLLDHLAAHIRSPDAVLGSAEGVRGGEGWEGHIFPFLTPKLNVTSTGTAAWSVAGKFVLNTSTASR